MVDSVRNIDIVWYIGVMCVVQTMAQVCPYSHPRCVCDEDTITCYNLQEIPPLNTGANLSQITKLSFEDGNITSISSSSLPPGLTVIWLLRLPLTSISDDALDTSAATLLRVIIYGARFTSLPTALKKLTKLNNLAIRDTRIRDWDAATLTQIAATLQVLELYNVGLFSWPSLISDCHLLNIIDLGGNPLISIPDDAFSSIKDTLHSLSLSGTGLTQVPQALSILSNLDSLLLSSNNVANLSEIEKITGSPYAQKLFDLSLDSVGILKRAANFSNLTSLRSISLSNNRISYVPAGSLPSSLITLDLAFNSLLSVPQDVASMTELSYLYLLYNLITRIEPNTFPPSLTYVELSSNNITHITNSTFRNLNLLRTLRLDDNPISTISPSAFSDLASLRFLYLTNSRLTEIPLAFAQLSPQTEIHWTTTQPLSCPCPAPHELVLWFSSLTDNWLASVNCSNGQLIKSHLSGQCGQSTATP